MFSVASNYQMQRESYSVLFSWMVQWELKLSPAGWEKMVPWRKVDSMCWRNLRGKFDHSGLLLLNWSHICRNLIRTWDWITYPKQISTFFHWREEKKPGASTWFSEVLEVTWWVQRCIYTTAYTSPKTQCMPKSASKTGNWSVCSLKANDLRKESHHHYFQHL